MFFNPGASSQGAARGGVASSNDAATTAWVAAVVAGGGTVSATQTTRVNTLIVALKAHSLFTKLDDLWLFAGESVAKQATIGIVNLNVLTAQGGAGDTLAAGGYTSNGTTGYLTSVKATGSGLYVRDSASFMVYDRTSSTTGVDHTQMGINFTSGPYAYCKVKQASNQFEYDINGTTFYGFANTNHQGFWHVTRTAASAVAVYKNGTSVNTGAGASVSISSAEPFYIQAINQGGSGPAGITTDQIAAAAIGNGFDATQAANMSTDLNAYMTAWGVNVY